MNKSTSTSHNFQAAVFGLLLLTLPMACRKSNHENRSAADAAPSQLAQEMIGTWVHVGTPDRVREAPVAGRRLKFRTGSHWNLTYANPDTGLVEDHFGGTYTLKGNEYVETQEYGDQRWMKDNGKSFKFTVKVEGDFMTQFGVDNPWTEVWKRVTTASPPVISAAVAPAPVPDASQNCRSELHRISGAKEQWALENRKTRETVVTDADLVGPTLYMREMPKCPSGGSYTLGAVKDAPRCSIAGHVY